MGSPAVSPRFRRLLALLWLASLSLASGLLYFASFPSVGAWPVAFFALSPLLIAVRNVRIVGSALLGLASGTLATLLGFSWLIETVHLHGGFGRIASAAVVFGFCVLHGGRFASFAALTCAMYRKGWPWLFAVGAAFIASETAYPMLFPWYLGATLHRVPLLIQTADLGGPVLVGLPLALINAAVADIFRNGRPRMPDRAGRLTSAFAVSLPLIYGLYVIPIVERTTQAAPIARVGVVQGLVPMPPATSEALHERFTTQLELSHRLANAGAELVVWPESAFVHVLPAATPGSTASRTGAASLDVPLLTGVILETSTDPPRIFNSALMLSPRGDVRGRYDKQYRLPFGEYIPLGESFPKLYRWSPQSGRISAGERSGPVPFEDKLITVLICYEDILPGFVRDTVQGHRSHLLVNLTNDGWFGRSEAAKVHYALSKLRAVEHRRYLVRATNTGVSAIIDPVGREQGSVQPFQEGSLLGSVRWLHRGTLFGLVGNAPWNVAAVVALVACWVGPLFGRRQSNRHQVSQAKKPRERPRERPRKRRGSIE